VIELAGSNAGIAESKAETVAGDVDFAATAFFVALSKCERKVLGTLRMSGLMSQPKPKGTVRLSSMAST
jgi:hypothetical protein